MDMAAELKIVQQRLKVIFRGYRWRDLLSAVRKLKRATITPAGSMQPMTQAELTALYAHFDRLVELTRKNSSSARVR